MQENY